ncbi:MAG: hypothetical protein OEX00_05730 [Gammaproteobacteria bacterium]|nr:hypothetical protein [Gammaproteobacteria bacterium]MDH5694468.1 hypothetical protein [Gammaproteobacteria bacterium]
MMLRVMSKTLVLMFSGIVGQFFTLDSSHANTFMHWHGFLSQGYLATNENNLFGNTEAGSIDFRELGINASYRPYRRTRLAGQIISRTAGKSDTGEPDLDYLFVDYSAYSQNTIGLNLYLGRVKNPFGFHNESRDMIFTRPGIILPQSIYFDRVRDLALSSDGFQLSSEYRLKGSYIDLRAGYVLPRLDSGTEVSLFRSDLPGDLKGKPLLVSRIQYSTTDERFKLAYTHFDFNAEFDFPDDSVGEIRFVPQIVSVKYSVGILELLGEYARRTFYFKNFPLPEKQIGESYYLQLQFLLSDSWKIVGRVDQFYADVNDRDGSEFAQQKGFAVPAHSRFARDYSLGLIWSRGNWLAAIEHHRVDGTGWLPVQDNLDLSKTERQWNMWGVMLSMRF